MEHIMQLTETGKFKVNSIRPKTIGDGIRKMIGTESQTGRMSVQAYTFAQDLFTPGEARSWCRDHGIVGIFKSAKTEPAQKKPKDIAIPLPKKDEEQADYIDRITTLLVDKHGMEDAEAATKAEAAWNGREMKKSIPWGISLNELREAISEALREIFPQGNSQWSSVVDIYLDGTCIVSSYDNGKSKYYKYDYSFDQDENVALTNQREVEQVTHWCELDDLSKAEFSKPYANSLPDDCFAYIEPGGEKDEDGNTKPRSLRHLLFKDADSSMDEDHIRNALARLPQVTGIVEDVRKSIEKNLRKALDEIKANKDQKTPDKIEKSNSGILKADEEKRLLYGVVLEPETEDSQGDIISADEIEKTAHDFMQDYRNQDSAMGEMHKKEAKKVHVVQSFVAPEDFTMNDRKVKKGSWVVVSKILNDGIWDKVKKKEYTGYSIGGRGKRDPVENK